jgi:predicted MFS family arabinose efflux permease
MLTDGALRMLVLLHFHELGYSPVQLAFLFLLYEFFGVVTNLFAGLLASKTGLKRTLVYGLGLQILALVLLSCLNPAWAEWAVISYIMVAQSLSGIAKDLTKMSSKTAVKFLVPEDQSSALFKWVSVLTGSKNAIKGAGFFVGGFLLTVLGFQHSLLAMALLIGLAFSGSLFLPNEIGRAKVKQTFGSLLTQGRNINVLSSARFFLFGARDIWFVVGVPIFFSTQLNWSFTEVGTFMACWVIGYGVVQSLAPMILKKGFRLKQASGSTTTVLTIFLGIVLFAIFYFVEQGVDVQLIVISGLALFGIVFALNSAVHSYLILHYADGDRAAVNVGFYYMANAGGRLVGTLFSGVLYQVGGLVYCLLGSLVFVILSTISSYFLPRDK